MIAKRKTHFSRNSKLMRKSACTTHASSLVNVGFRGVAGTEAVETSFLAVSIVTAAVFLKQDTRLVRRSKIALLIRFRVVDPLPVPHLQHLLLQ